MYILGCQIGEGLKNYLYDFANRLYQSPQLRHIEVHGILGLRRHEILKNMTVSLSAEEPDKFHIGTIDSKDYEFKKSNLIESNNNEIKKIKNKLKVEADALKEKADKLINLFHSLNNFIDKQVDEEKSVNPPTEKLKEFLMEFTKIRGELDKNKHGELLKIIDDICDKIKIASESSSLTNIEFDRQAVVEQIATLIRDYLNQLIKETNANIEKQKEKTRFDLTVLLSDSIVGDQFGMNVVDAMDTVGVNKVNYSLLTNLNQFDENRFRLWGLAHACLAEQKSMKPTQGNSILNLLKRQPDRAKFFSDLILEIQNPSVSLNTIIKKFLTHSIFLQKDDVAFLTQLQAQLKTDLKEEKDHKEHKERKDQKEYKKETKSESKTEVTTTKTTAPPAQVATIKRLGGS